MNINKIIKYPLTIRARRFIVSGLLATGLHVLVASTIFRYIVPIQAIANIVAFIVATITSYMLNTLWSFSSPIHGKNIFRFLSVSTAGMIIAAIVSSIGQHYELNYLICIGIVACIIPPITFLMHNFWTYR